MKVDPFLVEQFMNAFEKKAELNLAETCVDPFTLGDFLDFVGQCRFFDSIKKMKLTYGEIEGSPALRQGLADLYEHMKPQNILISGGAIAANFLVFYSLVEPCDTVISIFPAYQQLQSVAKSFGANVKLLPLHESNGWLPNIKELDNLVDKRTKLIVINNPHNPTGSLIESDSLTEICEIAERNGAYLLSDESYRGLWVTPTDSVPSAVDISDSAIATGSFSKPFSLSGLRLGWIAANQRIVRQCMLHRDYTTISNNMISDALATLAVKHADLIFNRSLRIIRANHEIVSRWVDDEPRIRWIPPKAGSSGFLRYNMNISSKKLCLQLLKEKSVLLVPGYCFGMEGYLRIGYGCGTRTLKAGLSEFKDFLNSMR